MIGEGSRCADGDKKGIKRTKGIEWERRKMTVENSSERGWEGRSRKGMVKCRGRIRTGAVE